MKRYLLLLVIIPFLTNCGTGGGGGVAGGNSATENGTTNKTNPLCSSVSNIAKIQIKEDGIYRIAYLDLYNACIDLSRLSHSALKMTNQGKEIAIETVDRDNNGIFDDGDYIEFYGNAIKRGDERFKYTETNVYWLSAGGGEKRIGGLSSSTVSIPAPLSFPKTLHREEDTWYEQKNYPEVASSAETREHWFWGEVFYTPGLVGGDNLAYYQRDYNFSTPYIDKDRPVSLKLRMQSVSGSHHIKVYINGRLLSDQIWGSPYSQEPFELGIEGVSASYLNSGPNVLRLESAGDTSSGIYELFYLNWFDVTYYHLYKAEHDEVEFTGEGRIELGNFTSSDISIYEISDPLNIKKITPSKIEGSPLSGYRAIFSTIQNTNGRFLALTDVRKRTPPSIDPYTPAGIRDKDANYIIITHEDFIEAISPLSAHRNEEGYKVLTVKVRDIYDEFGYGIETPQAVKEFLKYAYNNWPAGPMYVLLVGDATIDYKDISGFGKDYGVKSYVPAYLYNYPSLGEVPSDNWFVDVDGTNGVLPEMNIGRIPAKSPSDVIAVVNKILSHERSLNKSNNILLVADYDLSSGTIFEALSDSIAEIIPPNYPAKKLYQWGYPGDFRGAIISEINSGKLIVNYTGHGSVVDWGNEDIFSSDDVVYLTNKDRYPFVVAFNCLNGYFVLPNDGVIQDGIRQYPSIAETFLLAPEKGSVAMLAASAIGYPSEHDPLAQAFYSVVFQDGVKILGDAVTMAKVDAYRNQKILDDVVETFIFFGDPATRLE